LASTPTANGYTRDLAPRTIPMFALDYFGAMFTVAVQLLAQPPQVPVTVTCTLLHVLATLSSASSPVSPVVTTSSAEPFWSYSVVHVTLMSNLRPQQTSGGPPKSPSLIAM